MLPVSTLPLSLLKKWYISILEITGASTFIFQSCRQWKDTLTKRIVTRDVRCMTGWGNAVYGGGCDDKIFRIGSKPQSLNILPIHSHVSSCSSSPIRDRNFVI